MVLTRRAHKSIFRWLPNEVISEIIRAVRPSDQAALCRTTKLFHALGVPILYRVVALQGGTSIMHFCDTVLANSSKFAGLVRSLRAHTTYSLWASDIDSDDDNLLLLFNCCKALLRIENLSIEGPHLGETQEHLLSATFPSLISYTLSIAAVGEWTSMMSSFLIRHPALESLYFETYCEIESWPSTSARIPMLGLRRLRTPPKFLFAIMTAGLKEVRITFKTRPEPVEAPFAILPSLTRSDVPFICSIDCWAHHYEEIVDSVSRHMPHTGTLRIEVQTSISEPHSDTLPCFTKCLPRFLGLRFLSFAVSFKKFDFFEKPEEYQIRTLGNICPTLQACRIDNVARKKVNEAWVKFTVDEFFALASISWV
ncbi:hypothetical protein K438DRAFT_1865168 [Mycena galopus ATCC 62051]|nr:hypothetical protein K438DRAFT_1865168 [Mycena galopus ATCC 62051]